jgi:hypothetical protein
MATAIRQCHMPILTFDASIAADASTPFLKSNRRHCPQLDLIAHRLAQETCRLYASLGHGCLARLARQHPSGAISDLTREHRLTLHIRTLRTHEYITRFDADLGRKFAEDGEMSVVRPEQP